MTSSSVWCGKRSTPRSVKKGPQGQRGPTIDLEGRDSFLTVQTFAGLD
jgi:hypothetical protein